MKKISNLLIIIMLILQLATLTTYNTNADTYGNKVIVNNIKVSIDDKLTNDMIKEGIEYKTNNNYINKIIITSNKYYLDNHDYVGMSINTLINTHNNLNHYNNTYSLINKNNTITYEYNNNKVTKIIIS